MNPSSRSVVVALGLALGGAIAVSLWPGHVEAQGDPEPEALVKLRQDLQTMTTVQAWTDDSSQVNAIHGGFLIADASGRLLFAPVNSSNEPGETRIRWIYDNNIRKKIVCGRIVSGIYSPSEITLEEPFPQGPFIVSWLRAGMPSLPHQTTPRGRTRLIPDLELPPNTYVEFSFASLGIPEDNFAPRVEPRYFQASWNGINMAQFKIMRLLWNQPLPDEFYSDDLDDLCSPVLFHSVWGATSPPRVNGRVVGSEL